MMVSRLKKLAVAFVCFCFVLLVTFSTSFAEDKKKVKFYNFDDILIDGKVKKPKVLMLDARQRVKFGKLLKLKRDFIPKLKGTERDPTFR
tara:strand:+ start:535 stop:804 length:270 start_codon:yes stop_codon:yes gene_type:complete